MLGVERGANGKDNVWGKRLSVSKLLIKIVDPAFYWFSTIFESSNGGKTKLDFTFAIMVLPLEFDGLKFNMVLVFSTRAFQKHKEKGK